MMLQLLSRYWAKVDRRSDDECWPWKGARTVGGYGQMSDGTRVRNRAQRSLATHISLAIDGRERPKGEYFAMHSCDNPQCVNPKHLAWGTAAENSADMIAKGRSAAQIRAATQMDAAATSLGRGGVVKLTEDQARHILTSSKRTCDLAREFNVTWSCVDNVRRRITWRDIQIDPSNGTT